MSRKISNEEMKVRVRAMIIRAEEDLLKEIEKYKETRSGYLTIRALKKIRRELVIMKKCMSPAVFFPAYGRFIIDTGFSNYADAHHPLGDQLLGVEQAYEKLL